MPDKKLISVCLIVKNEEKMLPDCLESVKDIAGEIIVVDTGSVDETIAVAAKYGARVINSPWQDDFSQARNVSLDLAKFPFILVIDADERLLNPKELQTIVENALDDTGAWLLQVTSEAMEKGGGTETFVSNLLRLFRNDKDFRFTGIIHEQVLEPILQKELKIRNTNVEVLHLGYSQKPEQINEKQVRNLNLLNKSIDKDPENIYNIYQRAKTKMALGDMDEAEKDVAKAILEAGKEGAVKPQALNYGAIIAFQRGDYDLAEIRAIDSLELVPNQAFANYILAEVYLLQQKFEPALEYLNSMAVAESSNDIKAKIIGDYHLPKEQVHFRFGKCLVGLEKYNEAKTHFEQGNKINPTDVNCIVGLSNVAFKNEEYELSRDFLNQANLLAPGREDLKQFLNQVQSILDLKSDITLEKESLTEEVLSKSVSEERPLLSLSMIVKDEERDLPDCLESVKDIVDEIIIVDTGSKDKTVEIAESYGAKVYHFDWIDDFAAARNESMKHCTGEWILYLDADERIRPQSKSLVRNLLSSASDEIGGYIVTIESDHRQLDGSTELHRGGYPRLFRNYGYPKINFTGRVHEQITPSIFALNKQIDFSEILIEHIGYNQPREIMDKKVKRNYRMLMDHIKEEPLNGYAWYQLGQTLAQMRLSDEAENAIRFAIETGSLAKSVYASATATLSQLVGNKKNFEEALHWAEESLESAPDQVYSLNLKAYSLLYLKKYPESLDYFNRALKKLRSVQGVPRSGFDIILPEKLVLNGIKEAEEKLKENS